MTLPEFFDRYAGLSQQDAPELLAALYAPTFIAAGPEGSMSFANDARFLDWLKQVRQFNQQHGMRGMAVISVGKQTLSPRHTLARPLGRPIRTWRSSSASPPRRCSRRRSPAARYAQTKDGCALQPVRGAAGLFAVEGRATAVTALRSGARKINGEPACACSP